MYKAGDLVEVRSREEILATLDAEGRVDRMPFMPEMLKYCGKTFRVSAVAHKTCDTAYKTGGRRLEDAVHLESLRCDGSAHGGCQATCLFFWKTHWLKPAAAGANAAPPPRAAVPCTEAQLVAATVKQGTDSPEPLYRCQATQLVDATTPLKPTNLFQFWRDWRYGNVTLRRAARVLLLAFLRHLPDHVPFGYNFSVKLYRGMHLRLNGFAAPEGTGDIPLGKPTPGQDEGLAPGQKVRVRSHAEIKKTLNVGSKNRGMWFDHEMVKFCDKEYRVAGRVDRIIDEVSGKMLIMKSPCVVLDEVWCTAEYTDGRLLCRRAVTTYWRENWLERVAE
jgi:hypothetical protein